MILKTLTLHNFRKFKDVVVEFPDGVTGVIGLNGVGKSTLFEAVAWVLYGPVAARTASDEIKRSNTDSSDPCKVALEFVFEGDQYRVVREMSGKNLTASATALVNQKVAASGAETVSRYMQQRLGMDFKSFFTSIFAKQKELNVLSSMTASERRPLILKMLNIDLIDDVIREIRSDKKNKDEVITQLSRNLTDDETGRERVDVFKEELKKIQQNKEDLSAEVSKLKEELSALKKTVEKLVDNCEEAKHSYEKINNHREKLDEKKSLFEKKQRLQDDLKQLKQKIENRKDLINEQQKKIKKLEVSEDQLKATEKRLDALQDDMESLLKEIEQRKTHITQLKEDIDEVQGKRQQIEERGPDAACPTCKRELGDQYEVLLTSFDEEQQQKTKKIKRFSKEIEEKQENHERLKRQRQALQKKQKYVQQQLRQKDRLQTTISNLQDELHQEQKDVKAKTEQLEKIGDVDFDEEEYKQVKQQVEQRYKKYQSSLTTLQEKRDELNQLKVKVSDKKGEQKVASQRISDLQEKIKEQKEAKQRLEKERKATQRLNMLNEVMSSFRTHLISRIRPTLSAYASDFFERLTDGKYQEIELDEDYNVLVYDEGSCYGIDRFSGGEEDLANLCLRLAISEVITERAGGVFNFIILDEIFGSQDAIRRQNIMNALNSLSSKFRQIFLITHIEDVKNLMENVINVTEDENEISHVSIE